jgi:hypothetical protein
MSGGFPHSDIHGSKPIPGSPWLNAGYHVLHRLLLPRHPPNALFALDLIQKEQGPRSPDGPSFQYQKHTYPKTADRNLQSGQCTRLGTISSFGIQARCIPYSGTSNDTDVFSLYDVKVWGVNLRQRPVGRSNASADALDDRTVLILIRVPLSRFCCAKRCRALATICCADCAWWVEEDLNLRPHAYQACALTT